jgi:hypothetical protein
MSMTAEGWALAHRPAPEPTPIPCPECGQTEYGFEKRGDVRCYIALDPCTLAEDTHNTPIETLETDTNGDGEEIIYCNGCDSEFTEAELLGEDNADS